MDWGRPAVGVGEAGRMRSPGRKADRACVEGARGAERSRLPGRPGLAGRAPCWAGVMRREPEVGLGQWPSRFSPRAARPLLAKGPGKAALPAVLADPP